MKTQVIIGAAAAGIGVLNTLIKLDPNSRIICISDEKENPYNKCFLADYLNRVKQEHELNIIRPDLVAHPNLHFFFGLRVIKIDRAAKTILLDDGQMVPYDTLFIGTGSSPMMPPITGLHQGAGVFTFHTVADANKIMAYVAEQSVARAVVLGAGLSGLECADSLRAWGVAVTVIERSERVLARQVDQAGSECIAAMMERVGVELLCNQTVQEIMHENGRVSGVRFMNGTVRPCEMIIIATGLKPNGELAKHAGLEMIDGYIRVNEFMCTSDSAIFAAGDCVMVLDQVSKQVVPSCTWPDAMQQGSVAAHNMAQIKKAYSGALVITSSAFFGNTFVTCGPVNEHSAEYDSRISQGDDFYHKILLHNGVVKAYVLIGNTAQASKLRRALLTGERWS